MLQRQSTHLSVMGDTGNGPRGLTKGYVYAMLAAFFFAFIAILGKPLMTSGITPFQLMFYQYGFIIFFLGLWFFFRKSGSLIFKKEVCFSLLLQGLIGSVGTNFFFYAALKTLDAGMCSMLLFLNPVFVTLFFAITGIRKLRWHHYLSLILSVVGSVLVLGLLGLTAVQVSVQGVLLGLGSALCYGFYNVYGDLKLKAIHPNVINFYSVCVGFLCSAALLLVTQTSFVISISQIPAIGILALFSGVLPVLFIFKALQIIGSEKVTIIATVELPMTLLLAFLFLGEKLVTIQLVGVAMIVASTVLLHFNEKENLKVNRKQGAKYVQ